MLTINVSELIFTIINFFLLLYLLNRFLYKPLISFMEARKNQIDKRLAQERNARDLLQNEKNVCSALKKEVQEKAQQILHDAQTTDQQRRVSLIIQAKEENIRIRKTVKDAEIKKNQAEDSQIEKRKGQLASMLAENLLNQFGKVPSITSDSGLRLTMQKAENTWNQKTNATQQELKRREDFRNQTVDLFTSEAKGTD